MLAINEKANAVSISFVAIIIFVFALFAPGPVNQYKRQAAGVFMDSNYNRISVMIPESEIRQKAIISGHKCAFFLSVSLILTTLLLLTWTTRKTNLVVIDEGYYKATCIILFLAGLLFLTISNSYIKSTETAILGTPLIYLGIVAAMYFTITVDLHYIQVDNSRGSCAK